MTTMTLNIAVFSATSLKPTERLVSWKIENFKLKDVNDWFSRRKLAMVRFVVQIPDVRCFQRLVEERRLREEEEERERLEEERTPVFRVFVVDVVISECFEFMFEIDWVHPTVTVTTGLLHF